MSGSPDPILPRKTRGGIACRLSALLPGLLSLLLLLPAPARGEDFTIRSFRSEIEVRADASLRVVETIAVDFLRPRHGLYRDIPFRTTDDLGKESITPLRVVSVTNPDGGAWRYKVDRSGGFLRVRIGDPGRFVEGRQVYVITYTAENAILFFPDHDELYWNVTGNEWPVEIASASATATVSAGGGPLKIRTRGYTGPRGSREEAYTVTPSVNGATFIATREFRPGEGMTIVLGWEKGIVHPGSAWKATLFRLNLPENWVFLAPLFSLGYMLARWYRKGKDPSTGDPLVVAYAPPEENGRPLLPAEIGALIDERLDPKDITASVVDLAVKKQITIEEKKSPGILFHKTDYLLRKSKEPGAELLPFERLLMERLFQGHGQEVSVSELKLEFYKNLDDLKKAAFEGLERMKCFAGDPLRVTTTYRHAGFFIALGGSALALIAGKLGWGGSAAAVAAAVLSGVIVYLFSSRMPVKTVAGVKALERVKGFEEFLTRAEKDRLERMKDANLFEKYLPYAIALGVSERWARAFEGIYQEAPRWYVSEGGVGTFRPAAFHHSLGNALSSMSTAMYSSPRSGGSGFSGGGGSGGGGGGGGGGSW